MPFSKSVHEFTQYVGVRFCSGFLSFHSEMGTVAVWNTSRKLNTDLRSCLVLQVRVVLAYMRLSLPPRFARNLSERNYSLH